MHDFHGWVNLSRRNGHPAISLLPQYISPRTIQHLLQPQHRRQQNVHMAGFNLLDGANIQIDQFGQLFLSYFFSHPLTPNIGSESLQLRCLFGI